MGRGTIKSLIVIVALSSAGFIESKSLRERRDVTHVEFPPPRGSFSRSSVENSLVNIQKSAALRDMTEEEDGYGTRRLPLRSAVESIPPMYLRTESASHRIPMRDAVERRPPAYDDDLFALTDELESLGIDPWSVKDKDDSKPDKYQDQPHSDSTNQAEHHQYLIQLPPNEREQFSQLHNNSHHNGASMKIMDYYGAAKPYNYNSETLSPHHYAAYQPQYSGSVEQFRIDNQYQQLVSSPKMESATENDNAAVVKARDIKAVGKSPLIVCYIESWSVYRKAPMSFLSDSLPPICTHVLYAFATLHPESFSLIPYDNEYDVIQGGYRTVTGLKRHQPDLKVMISIGGERWAGAGRLSDLSKSPSRRKDFIDSALEFCKKHGFDGIDIHWQYPGAEDYGGDPSDRENLILLLKEMKEAFDPQNLIISMIVPASRYRIEDGYDAKSIDKYVEWVTLEGFDLRSDRERCSTADHHAPLWPRPRDNSAPDVFYNVDYAVRYWMKRGMPASKIVLGIPFFGRTFQLENGTNGLPGSRTKGFGNEGQYTQTKGMLAYFEICEAMGSNKWVKKFDEVGSPYMVHGDQWVGFDDKDSIVSKIMYVKKMGLAGGAAWAVDMDDFRGLCGEPWPLLSTLSSSLRELPVSLNMEGSKLVGNCGENEQGFMSDPNNCATYYLCKDGVKYELKCHDGTLFDAAVMYCRVMDPSKCLPGQRVKSTFALLQYNNDYNENDLTQEYHQLKDISTNENKRMVCYVTNWSFYRKGDGKFVPEILDTRLCTHVVYAYGSLDPETLTAKEFDPWADLDNNLYSRVTDLKDVKVLLGLGGWTDSAGDKYSRLVSSGSFRRNFVTNLVAFLRRYGFEGLQLDWNYPKCWQSNCAKGPISDKTNFAKLVKEISTEFKLQNPKMELGVSLSGYKEVIDVAYDLPSLGKHADFLSAMTYDYHGGWESSTSHGSPLFARPGEKYPQYTVDYAIKYLVSKGAPAEKLLLGIAFYGQSFQLGRTLQRKLGNSPGSLAAGPGTPGKYTRQSGMLAYYEVCNKIKNERWHTGLQAGAGPYAYHNDQWVGYEDAASITEKVQFANEYNLGGIVAWTVDLDDFNNVCCAEPFPLLRAANRALGRNVPSPPTTPCDRPSPPVTPAPPVLTTAVDSGASTGPTTSWTTMSTTTSPWWTTEKTTTSTTTTSKPTTTTTRTTTPVYTTKPPNVITQSPDTEPCAIGSYSPDPDSCGSYLQCAGGEQKRQQCAPGLHWNAAANLCDWPSAAHCRVQGDPVPKPTTALFKPTMGIMSTTQRMTTSKVTEPPRVTTQKPIITTQRKPSKKPKPTRRPHTPCQNGAYYSHNECDMFNICVNNVFVSQICAPGLAWNQQLTMCTRKSTCRIELPALKIAGAAPLNSPCVAGQFSGHPEDCSQYQQCLWGKFEAFTCSAGLHWNKDRKICDWPASAKCEGGQTIGPDFVVPTQPSELPSTSRPVYTTSSPAWTTSKPTISTTTEAEPFVPFKGDYKIVCYFTNWAWYRRGIGKYVPEDINPNLCTHIVYGFAVLDYENLIIKAHDSWADFDNRFYERVTAFKKKGLKVLLALGGWNDSAGDKYSKLVNSASARARFIQHALGFLEKHDFDGLDLDWEYPKCWQTDCKKGPDSDKSAFSAWVTELSAAFKPKGLLLSAAVSASKPIIDAGYDVPVMSKAMDWIAVMTYDYHGQWDKKTGHIAPLYVHPKDDVLFFNANYSMRYWIKKGAHPRKLVMGMPLYGQSFTLGTSWDTPPDLIANKDGHGLNVPARAGGQAGEYTRSAGFLSYYEICDRIKNRQWIVEQDPKGRMGPHAYKGDQWVGYDDKNMIRKKTQFAKDLNLGGCMIWALDLDDFKNSCGEGKHPLLKVIRETLESGTVVTGDEIPEEMHPEEMHPEEMHPEEMKPEVIKPVIPEDTVEVVIPPVEAVEAEEEEEEEPSNDELESQYKMVCYFTNWAWYRQGIGKYIPQDIDTSLCTHILYGFAVLDPQNLIIKPHDSWADIDNKFYEKVTAFRAKGVKVLLALGGWNDSAGGKYSKLVNDPSARRRFVIHALDFVVSNNFDGLDLDWEYPVCWQVECQKGPASDKAGFSALVKELYAEFHPKNLLLSAAVSPNQKVIDVGYDVPVLSKYLDWIAVMTYDYHGQWDKKTGHVAPMYVHPDDENKAFNVNHTIHHWISKGASRSKLVLGLSLYGQSFSLASSDKNGLNAPTYGGGEAGDFTRARGFLSYYEICSRIQNNKWTVVSDSRGRMGPYAYKGDQWVSFDDIAMIRHKSSYIKAMGLGGGMVWALDLDDFKNECRCEKYPLLSAAARELGLVNTKQPRCQLYSSSVVPELPESVTKPPVFVKPEIPVVISPPVLYPQAQSCDGKIFAPDPNDCNKYFLCNQGVLQTQTCPANLHWNKDHCDWPSNARCVPQGPGAIATTTTSPVIPTSSPIATTSKPIAPAKPVSPSGFKVVCYFTNWAWYRLGGGKYTPEDIDPDLCTHIVYGFAVLDPMKLTIKPHDTWADIDNDFYGKVTALRAKGKKVLIAIGGWNDSLGDKYSRLVNSASNRAQFITNVVEFINKWHFDGLDLDWEYPRCWQVDCNAGPASDKQGFASLVKELREAFNPRGWLISAAVSASKAVIDVAYDVPALARDLDWIAIMSYDYHGSWDRKTGHLSPLYYYPGDAYDYFNSNYSVNYWMMSGAPASKLVMGIPTYGQSFTLSDPSNRGLNAPASGPGDAGEYTKSPGFLAYYEICTKVKHSGWSLSRDPQNRIGPWAGRGTQWVAFDDTKMTTIKSELIKNKGLGGAMIWALDLDDFQNVCGCGRYPLLHAINAALRSQSPPTCDL